MTLEVPLPSVSADELLTAHDLHVGYRVSRRATLYALDGASFTLGAGDIVGVVGESGCGKSTLARALLGLVPLSAGVVQWRGQVMDYASRRSLRALRRDVQMVFQDPFSSLDPRLTIARSLVEPLQSLQPHLSRSTQTALAEQWLERVGLHASFLSRYPHELSGGQCQRVAIARTLIAGPALLICDEAVSALDVSVQAQIVTLLQRLQRELQLSLLFISHHLALVSRLVHRVVVLYLGRVVETGPSAALFERPLHPYTRALIDAVPEPDPTTERARSRVSLRGELPSPIDRPSGCVFRTRCPAAKPICAEQRPALESLEQGRQVACHRWREFASI